MKKIAKLFLSAVIELAILGLIGMLYLTYTMTRSATTFPLAQRQAMPWEALEAEARSQTGIQNLERLTLTAQDGLELAAWFAPGTNGATIIVLHGHHANHLQSMPIGAMLQKKGYGVLLLDFRSHGQSQGEQITFGCLERLDAQAAFEYLITRPEVDAERIGILGSSMGSATALLYAAQEPRIRAVVAHSPYTSLSALTDYQVKTLVNMPSFPVGTSAAFFFQRRIPCDFQEIAPIEHIQAISPRPVFILMGGQDTKVDPSGGEELYQATGEPRQLWFDPEVQHIAFHLQRAREFEQRVVKFFDQYLLDQGPISETE